MRATTTESKQPAVTTDRATVVAAVEEAMDLYQTSLKEAGRSLSSQRREDLRRLRALCSGIDTLPLLLYEIARYAQRMPRRKRSFCQWVRRVPRRSYLADLMHAVVQHHQAHHQLQRAVDAHHAAVHAWQAALSRAEAEHQAVLRRHQATIQQLLVNNRRLEQEVMCVKQSLRGVAPEADPDSPFRTPAGKPSALPVVAMSAGRRLTMEEVAAPGTSPAASTPRVVAPG